MHHRQIWPKLKAELAQPEILVLTGPRQVGKTTTLQWLLDQIESTNKLYFDLENLIDRQLFETHNYNSVIQEITKRGLSLDQPLYLAIDEIQLYPNLPSLVKYLYDHYSIKFLLTGSSSFYIKNRFSQSMAGRKLIFELFPLSFQEFLDFKDFTYRLPSTLDLKQTFDSATYHRLKSFYDEYLEFGGLPKVVLTSDTSRKRQLLEEIYSSYINLDVQNLADFKSTADLRNVVQLLAARVGNRLNVTQIANVTGLTRVTVDNYLEFLEATYLIRTIPAVSNSTDIRVKLPKKVYFIDTGIANINADLSLGSKFENTVRHQLSFYGDLSYFANRDWEIDFILKQLDQSVALEVKETPTPADAQALSIRSQNLNLTTSRLIGHAPSAKFTDYLWAGNIA